MKELKHSKQTKKKPGQFKKSRKRNLNIQHNRDQLKLLKEGKIEQAELFILDADGFKKVTIKPLPEYLESYFEAVYLVHHGRKSKLRAGFIISKDSDGRCKTQNGFIEWDKCYGIVVKSEMLKKNDPSRVS